MAVKYTLLAVFGPLFLLLAAAQLWLLHSLKDDINLEVVSVSRHAVSHALQEFNQLQEPAPPLPPINIPNDLAGLAPHETARLRAEVRVLTQRAKAEQQRQAAELARQAERSAIAAIEQRRDTPAMPAVHVVRAANTKLWASLAITCLLALLAIYLLARALSRPLEQLSQGLHQVASGHLGVHITPRGMGEVKSAINSFNQMSRELGQLREQEQRMQAQSQLAELGDVARGLAHSLRNPLHTIGLTLEGPCDETQRQGIRQKLQQMDNTIKALLTLSAQGVNRQQALVLSELLADIRLSIGGQWQLTLPPHCTVLADEAELRAMLHAIMSNAVEAAPGQSAELTVSQDEHGTTIRVHDQGPGLSDAIKARLFTPHATHKADGAGMGLYIAERLARLRYGGNLSLANHPDGGAEAVLFLPGEKPDAPAAG